MDESDRTPPPRQAHDPREIEGDLPLLGVYF